MKQIEIINGPGDSLEVEVQLNLVHADLILDMATAWPIPRLIFS